MRDHAAAVNHGLYPSTSCVLLAAGADAHVLPLTVVRKAESMGWPEGWQSVCLDNLCCRLRDCRFTPSYVCQIVNGEWELTHNG